MGYLTLDEQTIAWVKDKKAKRLEKIKKGYAGVPFNRAKLKKAHEQELVDAWNRLLEGTDREYDFFLHRAYKAEWNEFDTDTGEKSTAKKLSAEEIKEKGLVSLLELAQTTHKEYVDKFRLTHVLYLKAEGLLIDEE